MAEHSPITPRGWTVRRRLGIASGLSGLALVSLFAVGWYGMHQADDRADHAHEISEAQRRHQDLDMSHDAIQGIVATGLLGGVRGDLAAVEEQTLELEEEAQSVRQTFVYQAGVDLPAELRAELDLANTEMEAYLDAGAALLRDVVSNDRRVNDSELDLFLDQQEALEGRLGGITDMFYATAEDSKAASDAARTSALNLMAVALVAGLVIAGLGSILIMRSITKALGNIGAVAAAVADGDLSARSDRLGSDEIGELGSQFNKVADSLSEMVDRLRQDAERSAFGKELGSALEMVDTEREVYEAVQRAMTTAAGESRVELLLADSSQAHLEQATVHPVHGGAGCCVENPFGCAAVRRGATVVFRTSEALDACPKLVQRDGGPYAAVCAPVSFMGKALGVLHATRSVGEPFTQEQIDRVGTLATGVGTRIGTVRAFEKTQKQAATDGLTGLMNRRTMEERINLLFERGQSFAMAVADLDHFKKLNDTYGHDMGDRALRQFSEVLRTTTRVDDIIARWGGEEFTIVFPNLNARDAAAACDRIREAIVLAAAAANMPTFTASFGVVDSAAGTTLEELFHIADEALYAAKDAGRNRAVIGPRGDLSSGSLPSRHVVEHPAEMVPVAAD